MLHSSSTTNRNVTDKRHNRWQRQLSTATFYFLYWHFFIYFCIFLFSATNCFFHPRTTLKFIERHQKRSTSSFQFAHRDTNTQSEVRAALFDPSPPRRILLWFLISTTLKFVPNFDNNSHDCAITRRRRTKKNKKGGIRINKSVAARSSGPRPRPQLSSADFLSYKS